LGKERTVKIFLATEGQPSGLSPFKPGTYMRRESRSNFEKVRKKRPDFRARN
jgi:hypothetical protein